MIKLCKRVPELNKLNSDKIGNQNSSLINNNYCTPVEAKTESINTNSLREKKKALNLKKF